MEIPKTPGRALWHSSGWVSSSRSGPPPNSQSQFYCMSP
ncbi:hypothetical protein SAMCFNEI73_Ch0561 [Sinorhizobium americanum]|uniref:Uncharacterized protein n=1 Tax=Sinorhizobium americanum TaxID=194963 RepID=A0A1L3LIH4_9HYPH|nr:hypothetical protein SAMCFNEI73_Ch0561 [Sinorhizobium americanum]